MENGGFSNIEKLHMEEGDEARHQTLCAFFYQHYDDLAFIRKDCFFTEKECTGSSHCPYYTTNSRKAIQMYDQKYSVHDSNQCEYIDLSGLHPNCNIDKDLSSICFGLGYPHCPKNKKHKSNINNENIVEFCDSIRLYRYEENTKTNYYMTIKSIPVKPGLDIVFDFVGKKLGDKIAYNNQIWTINKIIKTEKSGKAFIIHKKNENKAKSQNHKKTIVCKFCQETILAKDLIRHLKKEHPKKN